MGFYGQVVYEFTKMFSKFMVKQSELNETPITPPENGQSIFYEADNMWEQINIEPANRWIQLDGSGGKDITKTISIGHGTPGAISNEKTTASVTKLNELPEDVELLQLKNGDYLQIATSHYDKAGHFIDAGEDNINPTYMYYRLPVASVNLGEDSIVTPNSDDTLSFAGDDHWITLSKEQPEDSEEMTLKFSHTILEDKEALNGDYIDVDTIGRMHPNADSNILEGIEAFTQAMKEVDLKSDDEVAAMEEYLQEQFPEHETNKPIIKVLESGDLVKAYTITKDATGHSACIEPIYYKLPVSATDVAFDDQANRITTLETRLKSGTTTNGTPYATYEDIVDKVYEAGELDDMYDYASSPKTITETIGQVNGNNGFSKQIAIVNNVDQSTVYTVSEALSILAGEVKTMSDTVSNLQTLVRGLRTDVDNLMKQ